MYMISLFDPTVCFSPHKVEFYHEHAKIYGYIYIYIYYNHIYKVGPPLTFSVYKLHELWLCLHKPSWNMSVWFIHQLSNSCFYHEYHVKSPPYPWMEKLWYVSSYTSTLIRNLKQKRIACTFLPFLHSNFAALVPQVLQPMRPSWTQRSSNKGGPRCPRCPTMHHSSHKAGGNTIWDVFATQVQQSLESLHCSRLIPRGYP